MSAIPVIDHQGRGLLTNPTDIDTEFQQFYSNNMFQNYMQTRMILEASLAV